MMMNHLLPSNTTVSFNISPQVILDVTDLTLLFSSEKENV